MKDKSKHFFVGQEVSLMQMTGTFRICSLKSEVAVVSDEHGFEITVPVKELVGLHGKESPPQEASFEALERVFPENGVFLLYDEIAAGACLYNGHSLPLMYILYEFQKNKLLLLSKGLLEPESTGLLFNRSSKELKHLMLACIWLPENTDRIPEWYSRDIRTHLQEPAVLVPHYKHPVNLCLLLSTETYQSFLLNNSLIRMEAKDSSNKRTQANIHSMDAKGKSSSIDLHIDALTDSSEKMQPHEKLNLQLSAFRKKLDECRLHKIETLVVIHGVGKGTLKNEILKILADEPGLRSKDAPYESYGYGATMVTFYS
ncbi:MAG: Smr/MutS family protein [Bacteroidota bacterium]|jgi:hypothetical protein